jgi:hypothetical protein
MHTDEHALEEDNLLATLLAKLASGKLSEADIDHQISESTNMSLVCLGNHPTLLK